MDRVDRRHPLTLVMTLGVIAAALGGALYMMRRADARMNSGPAEHAEQPVPVEVVVAARTEIPQIIKARGFLSGVDEVTVSAEVAGRVISRSVEDGAAVQKGDVLLAIDETFYSLAARRGEAEKQRAAAQLREAQSAVAQGEAQLESARAVLANRQDEYARIEELFKNGNSPPIEMDRATTALRTTEADVSAAQAALERAIGQRGTAEALRAVAEAALADAHAQLARCVVRAPISGRVNRYFVDAGEYALMSAPLVELVRLDEMKMNITVSDREVPLLEEFERAEVTADAAAGVVHPGKMHHLAPKLDALSKRFEVELRVDNSDGTLLSGMYGEAVLHCGELHERMLLPRDAVFTHFGVTHCLVVSEIDGVARAQLRQVTVRDVFSRLDELEVLDGLQEGERVITVRRRELHDGVAVEVVANEGASEYVRK